MFVKNSGDETGDETWKIQRDMKSKRIDFRRSLSRGARRMDGCWGKQRVV